MSFLVSSFMFVCLFVGLGALSTGGLGGGLGTGGVVKFEPVTGTDTISKNGVTQNVTTKLQCVSAMKQYETQSLEVSKLHVQSFAIEGVRHFLVIQIFVLVSHLIL